MSGYSKEKHEDTIRAYDKIIDAMRRDGKAVTRPYVEQVLRENKLAAGSFTQFFKKASEGRLIDSSGNEIELRRIEHDSGSIIYVDKSKKPEETDIDAVEQEIETRIKNSRQSMRSTKRRTR